MTILDGLVTRADLMLGRVTMYRLVTVALSAIALTALRLSALGRLPFGPVALLSSAGLLLATTYLSGRTLRSHVRSRAARRVCSHHWARPAGDPSAGADRGRSGRDGAGRDRRGRPGPSICWPSAVVTCSILLRWRRSYLGLVGVTHATWWVATPSCCPSWCSPASMAAVPDSAAPVGRRLPCDQRADRSRCGRSASGLGLGDAVWQSVSSWPLVFVAAFMLSEPLTLPPRRAQQWAVAGLVGSSSRLPVHLGAIYVSPEIALLVGNLRPFALARRVGITSS